jgi:hypothetical protein
VNASEEDEDPIPLSIGSQTVLTAAAFSPMVGGRQGRGPPSGAFCGSLIDPLMRELRDSLVGRWVESAGKLSVSTSSCNKNSENPSRADGDDIIGDWGSGILFCT